MMIRRTCQEKKMRLYDNPYSFYQNPLNHANFYQIVLKLMHMNLNLKFIMILECITFSVKNFLKQKNIFKRFWKCLQMKKNAKNFHLLKILFLKINCKY